MSGPERAFWKYIKTHLPGDAIRVENAADPGTPDVNLCYKGRECWIELKVCQNVKKIVTVESLLKDSQVVWHLNRGLQAENIYVMVRYPRMKMIFIYLHRILDKKNFYRLIKTLDTPANWKIFNDIILMNI